MKRKLDAPSKLLVVSIVSLVMSVVAQVIILLPVYSIVGGDLSDGEIDSRLNSALIWSRIIRVFLYLAIVGVATSLILIIARAKRKKNGKAV